MDIDDSGFELGMPTHQELLEHQCNLLCNENDGLRQELVTAKRNIEKLVEINAELNKRLSTLYRLGNQGYVAASGPQLSIKTWGTIGSLITPEEAASIQERLNGVADEAVRGR